MMADLEARVDQSKSRADALATAIKGGQSLEDAAKAAGLQAMPLQTNRSQPDPRLSGAPEMLGMLYSASVGKVIGPVRTSQGWLFARVDGVTAASDSLFNDQIKGQITNDVLNRRQRGFFDGYIGKLRASSQVSDLRASRSN
jgi:hypothetical protein